MIAKYLATFVAGLGQVLVAAQTASPQLQVLFPRQKWLGPAITAAGILWLGVQRAMDPGRVAQTNYSEPGKTGG